MVLPGQNKFSERFRSVIKKALYDLDSKERGHTSRLRKGDTPPSKERGHTFCEGMSPTSECPQRIMSPTDVLDKQGDFWAFLAGLKDLAVEEANLSGYAVINADNRQVSAGTGQGVGKVIYFSIVADNVMIRHHLGAGGTAVFIREGQVLAATGGRAKSIAGVNHVGKFSSKSISLEDALAAAAGLLALGIHPGELLHDTGTEEKGVTTPENAAIKS